MIFILLLAIVAAWIVVKAFLTNHQTGRFFLKLQRRRKDLPSFGYVSWAYQSESVFLYWWELSIHNRRLWSRGRQLGCEYYTRKLLESKRFKFDIYLIKFEDKSFVKPHVDPVVEGLEHHRINLVLRKPTKAGGITWIDGEPITSRVYKFRPDDQVHELSTVYTHPKKPMYMLSIGWCKNVKT